MRIEPGLTGYMTERGMRWHVIRADGTHEMQDASGRPFIRVKAWRKPNEDKADEDVALERLAIQCGVRHLIREPAHIEMLRAVRAQ